MTTDVQHLKMAEFSERSGVAASTIRYYLRLGLLPMPLRTSRTMAYYGPEHLDRLALIRSRMQSGATLRELGQELAGEESSPALADHDEPIHSSQRARLIDAGSATFLNSGFEATSVGDIVVRASVGKSAFYRHFAGKRELLVACIERELEWYERETNVGDPSPERLLRHPEVIEHRRMRALLDLLVLLRQADASRAIDADDHMDIARARLRAPLEADLRAGADPPGDERLLAEMLLSVAEHTLAYAAKSGRRDIADLVRLGWATVLGGRLYA